MLRQVTDGVVYSANRDSFVNWDMTLGTKWTAEEYTNSQGQIAVWSVSFEFHHLNSISRVESTGRVIGSIWNSIYSRSSFDSNWIPDSRNSYNCQKESEYSQVIFFSFFRGSR